MKRILIFGVLLVLLVAIAAVPALAQIGPTGGPNAGGGFCSPWDWAWFKAGPWWYWQWFHDCWNPQSGWFREWGGWGWF